MSKRIIVASHRRSGTHLTIDAIVNNVPLFRSAASNNLIAHLKRRLGRSWGHERHSLVYFRRRTLGERQRMFSKDDLLYFKQISGAVNRRLGYQ